MEQSTKEALIGALKNYHPIALVGDNSKSLDLIRSVAKLRIEVDADQVNSQDVVGFWHVESKETGIEWVDGSLTQAIKEGATYVINGLPTVPVLMALHSLVNPYRKSYEIPEKRHEQVAIHPEFRLVMVLNDEQLKPLNLVFLGAIDVIRSI